MYLLRGKCIEIRPKPGANCRDYVTIYIYIWEQNVCMYIYIYIHIYIYIYTHTHTHTHSPEEVRIADPDAQTRRGARRFVRIFVAHPA